ncbi:hypothetical protein D7W82_06075 [Corallococcus sp. CA049B]|nr:hypothetical protein D7W82_06075 [Corallococcus sp. CA049B]
MSEFRRESIPHCQFGGFQTPFGLEFEHSKAFSLARYLNSNIIDLIRVLLPHTVKLKLQIDMDLGVLAADVLGGAPI